MRALLLACAAGLLLAASACGGSSSTSAAGGGPGAAALVPADVAAFLSLNTDGDSGQVEQLREVAERFPIARNGIDRLVRDLAGSDVSWQEDVDPAVGAELALVLLADGETAVALTQPDDAAKLDTLVARSEDDLATREIDDWHAIGKAADLDAFEAARGGETLADSDAYAAALEDLPEEALAKAFMSGAAVGRAAGRLGGTASGVGTFETAGFVVEAVDDGLRFDGRATGVEDAPEAYEPRLLERVPDDAFLAVSFKGMDGAISSLRSSGVPFLPEVERGLGVTLDELATLLAGEGVLYARAGLPIPELTIALEPEDTDTALATLRKLAGALTGLSGGSVERTELDGVDVEYVTVEGVRIQFAAVDDAVLLTTGIAGIRDYRRDGDKLTGSDAYEEAADAADLGDRTSGLAYVDFAEALPVIEGLAGLAGEELPAEVRENLEALESLVVHSLAEDGAVRFGGTLRTR